LLEKFPFSLISFSFEKDFIKPYKLCLLNRRSLSVLHLSPSFWSIELRHQEEPERSIFSFNKTFFQSKCFYDGFVVFRQNKAKINKTILKIRIKKSILGLYLDWLFVLFINVT
jgi:hypothetical protein